MVGHHRRQGLTGTLGVVDVARRIGLQAHRKLVDPARGRQRRRMPREDVRVGRRDGDRYVEWGASIVPWQFAQTRPKISSPRSKLATDFTGSPQSAMKAV